MEKKEEFIEVTDHKTGAKLKYPKSKIEVVPTQEVPEEGEINRMTRSNEELEEGAYLPYSPGEGRGEGYTGGRVKEKPKAP